MNPSKILFRKGERVFLPGGAGAPGSFGNSVLAKSDLQITTSYVPGVNHLESRMLGLGSTVSGFFMFPSLSDAQRAGAYRHLPMSYAAIVRWLEDERPFDSCVVQVATPDGDGVASLGPAAEFIPIVMKRAKRIIAIVNARVPKVLNAPSLALNHCDVVFEVDEPLTSYGVKEADSVSVQVATNAALFIHDGAAIQLGLGKVPLALSKLLCARRGLRLHSGMISDGVMELASFGALSRDWNHVTTMLLGSASLYSWSEQHHEIHVRGCEYTHDPGQLATIDGLVAVNSALSVDLFGQCNLETASGRASSGAGGAPDFARAARLSRGGVSIVALPSTVGRHGVSRIVGELGPAGIVTLPRTEVDVVVTEVGSADLRGLSVVDRAQALIRIAAPHARAGLVDQWREIFGSL
jgi:acyl-CoA hydrolase